MVIKLGKAYRQNFAKLYPVLMSGAMIQGQTLISLSWEISINISKTKVPNFCFSIIWDKLEIVDWDRVWPDVILSVTDYDFLFY